MTHHRGRVNTSNGGNGRDFGNGASRSLTMRAGARRQVMRCQGRCFAPQEMPIVENTISIPLFLKYVKSGRFQGDDVEAVIITMMMVRIKRFLYLPFP